MPQDPSTSFSLNRRHLVMGALGAASLPVAGRAMARAIDTPATEQDVAFMRLAIGEAAKSVHPFGAVITRDDKVLASAHSTQEHDPTAYGEMVAIRNFLDEYDAEKLKGTTLHLGRTVPDVHRRHHVVRHRAHGVRCLAGATRHQDEPDHGSRRRNR